MRSILQKIFLNDAIIFGIILFNAIVIYLQVDGYEAPWLASAVRAGFCLLLIAGSIIGMSFINSIFVDAMVEDNNDEIKAQLDRIEKQLNELLPEEEQSIIILGGLNHFRGKYKEVIELLSNNF